MHKLVVTEAARLPRLGSCACCDRALCSAPRAIAQTAFERCCAAIKAVCCFRADPSSRHLPSAAPKWLQCPSAAAWICQVCVLHRRRLILYWRPQPIAVVNTVFTERLHHLHCCNTSPTVRWQCKVPVDLPRRSNCHVFTATRAFVSF